MPGIEALLYIISGCNELWNAGPNTFYNFETGEIFCQEHTTQPLSEESERLLSLACSFSLGLVWDRLTNVLLHFRELEHVHLELAIEALQIALFPRHR